MYYYKNKVKPILILCLVVIAMSISICVCLWDSTSIQKLKVDGDATTGDYQGKKPGPGADLKLGERLTIDGIGYTVGHKGTDMITVYSDNVKSKGVLSRYDASISPTDGRNNNYTGSEVFRSVETYYAKLKDKPITVGSTTYGNVSEYVVGHKDYSWNLWLPSVREMNLSNSYANEIEGSAQPVMEWYNSNARRKEYANTWYWLRSPNSAGDNFAFGVNSDGSLTNDLVNNTAGVVRVALNLKI